MKFFIFTVILFISLHIACAQDQLPSTAVTKNGVTIAASYSSFQHGKEFIVVYLKNNTDAIKMHPRVGRDSGFMISLFTNNSPRGFRDEDPTARTILEDLPPNALKEYRIRLNPSEIAKLTGTSIVISTKIYDPITKITFSIASSPEILVPNP